MEEQTKQETVEEVQEQVDTQPTEPTVTVAEMKRRINNEKEKQGELESQLKAVTERLEEIEKQGMTPSELTEWEKAKQEQELSDRDKRIAELETLLEETRQENVMREMRDEAIKELNAKEMPINEQVLGFVVKDTAEATLKAISDMESLLKAQKKEQSKTSAPTVGAGGYSEQSVDDLFRKAKITNF